MRQRKRILNSKDLCITLSKSKVTIKALNFYDGIQFTKTVSSCCNSVLLVVFPVCLDETEYDMRFGRGIALCETCNNVRYLSVDMARVYFK